MAANRRTVPPSKPSRSRPATTPEAQETRMISLAEKLAESQMRDGSASAQVITHYLKLASSRERLEQERIAGEVKLQAAKIEAMGSTQRLEELYGNAMRAFSGYQGRPPEESDEH